MSKTLYERVWSRYGKDSGEDFIKSLRSQMLTHGVSQGLLARRSGFDEARISRWVNRRGGEPQLRTKLILDETMDQIIREGL